jgi:ferric enterobactin receptor
MIFSTNIIFMFRLKATLFIVLVSTLLGFAQKRNLIKGTVLQNSTNKPITGAVVLITENGIGTSTDSLGRFELRAPSGIFLLEISHTSYFKKYQKIEIRKDLELNFVLDDKTVELEELKVSANSSEQNVKRLGTGITNLNARTLKKLPTLLGEVDIIKSLYTLPGVTSVGEGATGFNVRGGNIDQNLILQDEAPIFNSSHLMGFFSVFNPDAFRDFNFYRGGVPAQYGGRISSVLNVNLKDANASKLSINGGIGTISSRLMLETPIIKDKLGFFVAGRISYIDQLLNVVKIKSLAGAKANFYDITSKIEFRPTKKDRISVSFFQGQDNFKLAKDTLAAVDDNGNSLYDWSTTNVSGSWARYFGPKFSTKISAVQSIYDANINNADSSTAYNLNYNLNYQMVKGSATYIMNPKNELDFGFQFNRTSILPGTLLPTSSFSNKNKIVLNPETGIETALFISDKIELNSKISFAVGLRAISYAALGNAVVYNYLPDSPYSELTRTDSTVFKKGDKVKSYQSLEPRLSFNVSLSDISSIKISANRMRQFLNLLSGTTAALPTDRWKLADAYIKPQMADQISAGYFRNIKGKSAESSLEFFYKKLYNVIDYKDGETLLLNKFPETAILQGDGYAFGAELFLKKSLGVFTGWMSYTYSQTFIKVAGKTPEETINNGEYFPPIYNRPHSFNAIGSYQQSKKVSFSGNINYSSGRAITYPASKFYYSGAILPFYNNRNQDRIPAYIRADISMNIESHPYRTSGYRGSWNFSIYNLLGRKNAYSVFFRARNPYNPFYSKVNIYKLSVLGAIIPSVTYNFKF